MAQVSLRKSGLAGVVLTALIAVPTLDAGSRSALAATIAPPMHDISAQCASGRNATAMSECIVAESEARAEILQKWDKVSDASAEKCLRLGKKTKKFPYSALAKCVAAEPVEVKATLQPIAPADAPATGVSAPGRSLIPSWVGRWTGFQKNEATR